MCDVLNVETDVMILCSFVTNPLRMTPSRNICRGFNNIMYALYMVHLLVVMQTVTGCTVYEYMIQNMH